MVQDTHEAEEIGWFINRDLIENVYQWIIELHSFDDSLPLTQDMKKNNIKSVVMEARFGKVRTFPTKELQYADNHGRIFQ